MLRIISTGKWPATALFMIMVLLIAGCGHEQEAPDVSGVPVTLQADRFERDMMSARTVGTASLREKYPDFFGLFFFQVAAIGSRDSLQLESRIADYLSDPDIDSIYAASQRQFPDFSEEDSGLSEAFRYYRHYFPSRTVPRTLTFISGFANAIVCADSLLGIGLDMYLGSDYSYYQAMQFPHYRRIKMRKEYIVSDAVRGWLQSEWAEPETNSDLLSHMIYQGKILYVLRKLMPAAPDTLLTGYSASQLEWCRNNEKNIWSFFIDHRLLFSSEQNQVMKYVTEGPTTNGFPKESPGNIGQWIGYRIVEAWAGRKQDAAIDSLMSFHDSRAILQQSEYKP
jgi:hypothetical protein